MKIRSYFLTATTAFSLLFISGAAFADGMPFAEKKPQPILTPLDKAIDNMEGKQEPAPVAVTPAPEPKAEVQPVPESRMVEVQPNTSFFGLSIGMYDPFTHGEQGASLNLEFQPGVKLGGVLQPLFGAIATTNGSLLGYGGIGIPFKLSERVFAMPSVAVGAYHEGSGVDLGRTLAFRVGTELAYEFDDKSRFGLNMHILSNGTSLNREDRTEIIGLAYTIPLENMHKSEMAPAPATSLTPSEQAPPPPATNSNPPPKPHEFP